jgi:hypothetical protein
LANPIKKAALAFSCQRGLAFVSWLITISKKSATGSSDYRSSCES